MSGSVPGSICGRIGRACLLPALLLLASCQIELFHALPESEANEMVALLLQNGIAASKTEDKDGSDTILVDKPAFAAAEQLLRARGYPRHAFKTMGDIFQPSGLVASPMQEQARFLWALSQELSGTVSEIDGVLTARVQVVLPDNDLLKRDPTPSSASVFIRYDDQSGVTRLVPQIKMLVADSVQGLTYDKVSVVLVPVPHAQAPVPRTEAAFPAASFLGPEGLGPAGGAIAGALMILLLGAVGFALRGRIAPVLASTRLPRRVRTPRGVAE